MLLSIFLLLSYSSCLTEARDKEIAISGVFTCTCKVSSTKCGRTFNMYMLEEDNPFIGDYDDVILDKTSIDWERPFTATARDDELGQSEPYIGAFTETKIALPETSDDYFINFGRISFSADDYVLQLHSSILNAANSTVA